MPEIEQLTPRPVRSTGGASLPRLVARRWFLSCAPEVEGVVLDVLGRDAFERRPTVAVAGADEDAWRAWLGRHGTVVSFDDAAPRGVDVAVLVDHLAAAGGAGAAASLRRTADLVRPGGRVVIVDRVVSSGAIRVLSARELLDVVVRAMGGAVTLESVRSLTRPGESSRSSLLVRLVRLGTPT